jgi:hypothetical protein
VVERAWWDDGRIVGQMAAGLPDHHHPCELPLAMAPRLIELCFQTAGLWEMAIHRRMGLPHHIDRVCLYRAPELADGPLYAVVKPGTDTDPESFDADVVDTAGNLYLHLRGYRTVTLREIGDSELLQAPQTVEA